MAEKKPRKHKFIKGAIKHPGRETERAKEAGRSVHAQMEHDKHSKNKSLRSAANLGIRLTGGDLSPHKSKSRARYAAKSVHRG